MEEENDKKETNDQEWRPGMNFELTEQVFALEAFLNKSYFEEFWEYLNYSAYINFPFPKNIPQTSIAQKFEYISSYLWDQSHSHSYLFENYPKLNGRELRKYFNSLKEDLAVKVLHLPPMVTLPLGPRGKSVSDEKLEKALRYSEAMKVYEGDEDTTIKYKGYYHNKSEAKLVHMYVEELFFKNKLKCSLIEHKESMYEGYDFKTMERKFYSIMEFQRSEKKLQEDALFISQIVNDMKTNVYSL